jgi:hypothetical protein
VAEDEGRHLPGEAGRHGIVRLTVESREIARKGTPRIAASEAAETVPE